MENEHRSGSGCALLIVGAYLAFAVYAWFDFVSINHDGLANLGLMLVTAPVALLDLAASGGGDSILMPDGHGYLMDHAMYYVPAVAVTAMLIWITARGVGRVLRGPEDRDDQGRK